MGEVVGGSLSGVRVSGQGRPIAAQEKVSFNLHPASREAPTHRAPRHVIRLSTPSICMSVVNKDKKGVEYSI